MKHIASGISKKLPFIMIIMNLAIPVFLSVFIIVNAVEHSHAAQQAAQPAPPKIQATVKSVDTAKNLLTIKLENRTTALSITPQTKISTADGQLLALGDIKKGDEVKVAWKEDAGKAVASEVAVILPAQFKDQGKGGGKGQGKGQGQGKIKQQDTTQ